MHAADDGDPATATPYRGDAEDYSAGVHLNFESAFVDRELVNKAGIDLEFRDVRATCGACASGNGNEFPEGKVTVYIPFVEGRPFSYGVSMTACAGIYRETFGLSMGNAPGLNIAGSVAAAYADRSLYFDGATILDESGTEFSLAGPTSSLGLDDTQAVTVPEPSAWFLMVLGLLLALFRRCAAFRPGPPSPAPS